jgi:CRISPR-associated protein Cst2
MFDLSDQTWQAHQDEVETISDMDRTYRLKREPRIQRVQDVVRALARLRGGAHLARNLSEVAPVIVLVGFLDGGNAPFQRLFEPDENNERVRLNLTRLRSVLSDYNDRLLKPNGGKALFFGYRPTVLANEEEVIQAFTNDEPLKNCIEVSGTPQQALEEAANAVSGVFSRENL